MTSMQIDNAWEIYRAYNIRQSNAWFDDVLWAYAVKCAYRGHEPGQAVTTQATPRNVTTGRVSRIMGIRKP